MDANDAISNKQHAEVRLELLGLATQRLIHGEFLRLADVTVDVITEAEFDSIRLVIEAYVTAAKQEGDWAEVSSEIVQWESVPVRPVRDGLWSLLAKLRWTPIWLHRFFLCHLQLRGIPSQIVIRQQKVDYYGCPHAGIPAGNGPGGAQLVHIAWMAEQSGQVPPGTTDATMQPPIYWRPDPDFFRDKSFPSYATDPDYDPFPSFSRDDEVVFARLRAKFPTFFSPRAPTTGKDTADDSKQLPPRHLPGVPALRDQQPSPGAAHLPSTGGRPLV